MITRSAASLALASLVAASACSDRSPPVDPSPWVRVMLPDGRGAWVTACSGTNEVHVFGGSEGIGGVRDYVSFRVTPLPQRDERVERWMSI